MRFGDFIKALNPSQIMMCSSIKLAITLLCNAGIQKKHPEQDLYTTVQGWLRKGVPRKMIVYFPKGIIDEANVLKYFRSMIDSTKMEIIQKEFSKAEEKIPFICTTKEPEEFYKSLLVLFVDSLGFALLAKRNNNDDDCSSQNRTASEKMIILFCNAIEIYNVADYMCNKFKESNNKDSKYQIESFVNHVRSEILGRFVNSQKEAVYKKIKEFIDTLISYDTNIYKLNNARTLEARHCVEAFRSKIAREDIDLKIKKATDKLEIKLAEEKLEKDNLSLQVQIHMDITVLAIMKYVINYHFKIDSIYSEICDGKTLFVY